MLTMANMMLLLLIILLSCSSRLSQSDLLSQKSSNMQVNVTQLGNHHVERISNVAATVETSQYSSWIYYLFLNVLCYSIVFIPGIILRYRYFSRGGPAYHGDRGYWSALQRICFYGNPDLMNVLLSVPEDSKKSDPETGLRVPTWLNGVFCCVGLQVFLPWGLLQEKIMTREYGTEKFGDSQFLVFSTRMMGLVVSGCYLVLLHHKLPPHRVPFYKYSFASFSNVMSSWFQYEALKYVSFPTQILAKATKIIPTMLMGKLVNGNVYKTHEYTIAALISVGMSIFLFSRWSGASGSTFGALAGTVILSGYILFDSFTSNWQEHLRKEFKMSSMQMMFGTNAFSVLLISVSLIVQGGLFSSVAFAFHHPEFLRDILIFSSCATVGQLFIFYTINSFGAVIFVIIMTVRQFFSVLLSYLFYDHEWSALAFFGIFIVFLGLSCEVYVKFRSSKNKDVAKNTIA